jgi:flagellar L-ring protein precursor FlgH
MSYLASYPTTKESSSPRSGSLWSQSSAFADFSADLRASRVNDLITVRIVEDTLAQASSDVSADRKFSAQSGITALAGKFDTSGISSLFSPQSSQSLSGKGQANSQTRLRSSVGGRIVAVLPNGVMVIEAERSVKMNNETQTIVLRGMVRPADVMADNTVLSTALSNLEVELKGKGVVSDATRPPNRLVRALLWLAGF